MIKKILLYGGIALLAIILLIQLLPIGRNHTNPPLVQEPNWDSPQTRELARRACFDCHSNETVYPWYANIAPVSWMVTNHINEGRSRLNFSDWAAGRYDKIDEVAEVITENKMPPAYYTLIHKEARLTEAEKLALAQGLEASLR